MCVLIQSCPNLCDPMDCSLPGSSVHGILQARIRGVGSLSLLQGIFPIQGLSPHLLLWQADSLPLSHQRSHDGISALKSRGRDLRPLSLPLSSLCHVRIQQEDNHLQTKKRALIRNIIGWHLELGLSCLQKCNR